MSNTTLKPKPGELAGLRQRIKSKTFWLAIAFLFAGIALLILRPHCAAYLDHHPQIALKGLLDALVELSKDLPTLFAGTGATILVLFCLQDEVRHYIGELLNSILSDRDLFSKFTDPVQEQMIRSTLGKHVPTFVADAVMAQIALAKTHQLPLGRKNIVSYSLEIDDFLPGQADVPYLANPANYFRCTFRETYKLLLREDELGSKDAAFYQFFTLEPNYLEELFQKDRCLYRDLLLLTAADHERLRKVLAKAPPSGQTQDAAKFNEFLMTEMLVRCGGKERTLRPGKFFLSAKGIRISFPLAHFDFTGQPDKFQVEIVNTVHFPLCKEVSGYPLIFMSYSYSPRIDVTFPSNDIETVELFPFFSGVPPKQCRVEKPGRDAKLEFPECWVLPSSGVYVAWRLTKSIADPASPGAAQAAPAVI